MRALALTLAALALAGCAAGPLGPLEDAADQAEAAEEDQSLTDRAADRLIPADDAQRPLRAALLMVTALNTQTVKATQISPERRAEVLGNVALARAGIERLRAPGSRWWRDTTMAEITIGAGGAARDTLRGKIARAAEAAVSALGGIRYFATNAAIDGAMISASLADARAIMAAVEAGELSEGEAWDVVLARIEALEARLSG